MLPWLAMRTPICVRSFLIPVWKCCASFEIQDDDEKKNERVALQFSITDSKDMCVFGMKKSDVDSECLYFTIFKMFELHAHLYFG